MYIFLMVTYDFFLQNGSTVKTFWLTGKTVEGSVAKSKDNAKVVGMRSGFVIDGEEVQTADLYTPAAAEVRLDYFFLLSNNI